MRPLEHCTLEQAIDDVVDTDLSRFLAKACGGLLSREEYLVREINFPVKMDHNIHNMLELSILAGVRDVAVRGGGGRWRRVQGGRRLRGGRRGGTVALLPLFSDFWLPWIQ